MNESGKNGHQQPFGKKKNFIKNRLHRFFSSFLHWICKLLEQIDQWKKSEYSCFNPHGNKKELNRPPSPQKRDVLHFQDSVSRQISPFQIDWAPLSKTIFEKISSVVPPPKTFLSFFEKKCIFTIVFLGESGHFESTGPPFQIPFFAK